MAKETKKVSTGNKKDYGTRFKKKRTSIGKSRNSRPKGKDTVREKKGR